MTTEERLSLLEQKMTEHETLIRKLKAYAALFPKGRVLLKALGAP